MTSATQHETELIVTTDDQMAETTPQSRPSRKPIALVMLIFFAFIALGMPDGLLGVGWPTIRAEFGIPVDAIGMILLTTMIGYLISSFFSGAILRRFSVGKVLIASCFVSGVGLIGYTFAPKWGYMAALGLLAGLGAGTIDAGLNAFVDNYFGPGLMQWLHASYGVGVTTGPLLMTYFLTNFSQWRHGYVLVGAVQLILSIVFTLTLPMWAALEKQKPAQGEQIVKKDRAGFTQTLRSPMVWLSAALFFLYVGGEVILGTWTYSLLTESRGVRPELAGLFASSYWLSFTIGRILAGLITHKVNVGRLVIGCMLAALAGAVLLLVSTSPITSLIAVAVIGFAFAPIFPGLVSTTAQRVGKAHVDNAIGIQISTGVPGGAILSSLVGRLAKSSGLEVMPVTLLAVLALEITLYLLSRRKLSNL